MADKEREKQEKAVAQDSGVEAGERAAHTADPGSFRSSKSTFAVATGTVSWGWPAPPAATVPAGPHHEELRGAP